MAEPNGGLASRLASLPGVDQSESMFGHGLAFWANGMEIAHFEGPGTIEVRLTKGVIQARRPELKADPRVTLRRSGADWLTVQYKQADADFVVELVAQAEAAHRPPPGVPAAPPPTGADLQRRKRFH